MRVGSVTLGRRRRRFPGVAPDTSIVRHRCAVGERTPHVPNEIVRDRPARPAGTPGHPHPPERPRARTPFRAPRLRRRGSRRRPGLPAARPGQAAAVRRLEATAVGSRALQRLSEMAVRVLDASSAVISLIADVELIVGGAGLAPGTIGRRVPLEESLCAAATASGPGPLRGVRRLGRPAGVGRPRGGRRHGGRLPGHAPHDVLGRSGRRPLRPGPAIAAVERGRRRPAPPARRRRHHRAGALGAVPRVRGQPAALRAGHRRGGDRQLRLGPDQRPAHLGRPADRDLRLRPGRLRRARSRPSTPGCTRTTSPRVSAALQHAIDVCGAYEAEYRIVLPDGGIRWVLARGRALGDDTGTAVRLLGAAYDTTDERAERPPRLPRARGDERRLLLAGPRLALRLRQRRGRAAARALAGGAPRAARSGRSSRRRVGSDFEVNYRGAAETGEERVFEAYYPAPLDAWYEVRAWPGPDGLSVYFLDISRRRAADERARASAARLGVVAEVDRRAVPAPWVRARPRTPRSSGWREAVVPVLADWAIASLVGRGRSGPRRRQLAPRPRRARGDGRATPSCGWLPWSPTCRSRSRCARSGWSGSTTCRAGWRPTSAGEARPLFERLAAADVGHGPAAWPAAARSARITLYRGADRPPAGRRGPRRRSARWPTGPRSRWTTRGCTSSSAGWPRRCSAACSPRRRSPTTPRSRCATEPAVAGRRGRRGLVRRVPAARRRRRCWSSATSSGHDTRGRGRHGPAARSAARHRLPAGDRAGRGAARARRRHGRPGGRHHGHRRHRPDRADRRRAGRRRHPDPLVQRRPPAAAAAARRRPYRAAHRRAHRPDARRGRLARRARSGWSPSPAAPRCCSTPTVWSRGPACCSTTAWSCCGPAWWSWPTGRCPSCATSCSPGMRPRGVRDDVALVALRLHPQDRPRPASAAPAHVPPGVPPEPA